MKQLINKIYSKENNNQFYSQALNKGWSFSSRNVANKDGRIIVC